MYEREILAIYKKYHIESFPVDVMRMIRSMGYEIMTYTELANGNHEDMKTLLRMSGDAFVHRKYKILAYNEKVHSQGRIRFSMAHEIAHILLNIDDENVANDFASNFLAPRPVTHLKRFRYADQLKDYYGISIEAANQALINLKMYTLDMNNDERAMKDYFRKILFKKNNDVATEYIPDKVEEAPKVTIRKRRRRRTHNRILAEMDRFYRENNIEVISEY